MCLRPIGRMAVTGYPWSPGRSARVKPGQRRSGGRSSRRPSGRGPTGCAASRAGWSAGWRPGRPGPGPPGRRNRRHRSDRRKPRRLPRGRRPPPPATSSLWRCSAISPDHQSRTRHCLSHVGTLDPVPGRSGRLGHGGPVATLYLRGPRKPARLLAATTGPRPAMSRRPRAATTKDLLNLFSGIIFGTFVKWLLCTVGACAAGSERPAPSLSSPWPA
jgi:hypothetical protein